MKLTPLRIAIALCWLLASASVLVLATRGWLALLRKKSHKPMPAEIDVTPPTIAPDAQLYVGPSGTDANGYPKAHVDRLVLRGWLHQRRFAELTKAFEEIEDAFEKDPRKESWVVDAGDAFSTPEPALKEPLDAWVTATPDSFAPYLARASHAAGIASRHRRRTSDAGAPDDLAGARADLERAATLRPSCFDVERMQMVLASSRAEDLAHLRTLVDQATAKCPECFGIRATYLVLTTPTVGGSFDAMDAYAKAAPTEKNGRLKLLPGYVLVERARAAREKKDTAGALADAEGALAIGEDAAFFEARALAHWLRHDWPAARADLDRAALMRPQNARVLGERAEIEEFQSDFEASANDLLAALRLDPTQNGARGIYSLTLEGLLKAAEADAKKGSSADAARLAGLAKQLAPSDPLAARRISKLGK